MFNRRYASDDVYRVRADACVYGVSGDKRVLLVFGARAVNFINISCFSTSRAL